MLVEAVTRVLPMRIHWTLILLLGMSLGCQTQSDPPDESVELEPIVLRWPLVEGADRYELRVWAGERLLFEESIAETLLILPESLRRTVAAFDTVEVVVRGLRQGERMDGEPLRWMRPAAE